MNGPRRWIGGPPVQAKAAQRSQPSAMRELPCASISMAWRESLLGWPACEHARQGARVPRADNWHGVGPGRPARRAADRSPGPPNCRGSCAPGLVRVTGEVRVAKQVLEAFL